MTSLTAVEIKIIFFGIIFITTLGAFVSVYNLNPVPTTTYTGLTETSNQTSSSQDIWILGLIGILPAPFNDPDVLLISSIIITPIVVMLSYISIRALKDQISQWV